VSADSSAIPNVHTEREVVGHVSAPSGKLVILDGGLMYLWQHDRPPLVGDSVEDEKLRASMDSEVDLQIEGPEAEAAGKLFDRQWHPRYVFDVPRDRVLQTREAFEKLVREKDLIARIVELPERITHRRRIDLVLEQGSGAGEISFHGMWATVIANVPTGTLLPVIGQRMTYDPDKSRWRHVLIECRPEITPQQSKFVGYIGVDEARVLVADADALGAWKHEESLDGLADYVFWGKDAKELADALGAASIRENEFGWIDCPVEEAIQLGKVVQRARDERKLIVRGDFRPHSHHYLAMDQARQSSTDSGTVHVGGAAMCLFMTTWGDGAFRVYRDLGADGQLVASAST
jgi:hypothetical protein